MRVISCRLSRNVWLSAADHLAANHAAGARSSGECRHERAPNVPEGCVSASASTSNERDSSASPARIAVASSQLPVAGRPTSPHIVIVHRGQIVVHQGISVHHLDRGGGAQRASYGHVEHRRTGRQEIGSDILAAAERRIAHRFADPRFRPVRRGQEPVQRILHASRKTVQRGRDRHVGDDLTQCP